MDAECSLDAAIHLTDSPDAFPIGLEVTTTLFSVDGKQPKSVEGKIKRHYPVPDAPGWAYVFIGDLR